MSHCPNFLREPMGRARGGSLFLKARTPLVETRNGQLIETEKGDMSQAILAEGVGRC